MTERGVRGKEGNTTNRRGETMRGNTNKKGEAGVEEERTMEGLIDTHSERKGGCDITHF